MDDRHSRDNQTDELSSRLQREFSDTRGELDLIRRELQKLVNEATSNGIETRWAAWLSFVVLCIIAWRVW